MEDNDDGEARPHAGPITRSEAESRAYNLEESDYGSSTPDIDSDAPDDKYRRQKAASKKARVKQHRANVARGEEERQTDIPSFLSVVIINGRGERNNSFRGILGPKFWYSEKLNAVFVGPPAAPFAVVNWRVAIGHSTRMIQGHASRPVGSP